MYILCKSIEEEYLIEVYPIEVYPIGKGAVAELGFPLLVYALFQQWNSNVKNAYSYSSSFPCFVERQRTSAGPK